MLSVFLVASLHAARVVGDDPSQPRNDEVTIAVNQAINLLDCVADECKDQLRTCHEDSSCKDLMGCTRHCNPGDFDCMYGECETMITRAYLTSAGASWQRYTNFTGCLVKNCPRPLQETEQIDRERQAREQDTICFLHLGPISEMMNSTNVQPDDACVEELTNDLDLVEDSRDECPGEFDLIYSNTRNSLHSNPDVTRCPALFENLKNRVNAVLLDKAVDLSIDENPTAEEQGETDTCRNLVFNEDRDPWEDSDGDTCAVYKRYVCRDPRYPTPIHTIQTDCESGDCKGTGGYYATDACCACGGGAQVGHQHKFGREENRDMINQNRCMLASCLMKVGDCQTHEGCIRGLGRVAKAYQHFHHHHNSTGWCEIQELTIEQCLQYHTSGLSAEAKSSLLLVAECASTQEQECEPSLSPSTSSPITSAPTPLPTENPTLAPTSPSSAPTTVSPTVAEEASTVTDDTKGAHNGNDGGTKKQPVGLIVGLSLLGGVVAICGLAGGYVLYKRKVRREFRRVLASDEEDALRGMRSLPAGGLQVLEPEL